MQVIKFFCERMHRYSQNGVERTELENCSCIATMIGIYIYIYILHVYMHAA